MKIRPTRDEFRNWLQSAPDEGDLIFFKRSQIRLFQGLAVPIYSAKQARAQGVYPLHHQTWYDYALSRSHSCAWLPAGAIESMDEAKRARMARLQIALKAPTLIRASSLNAGVRKKLFRVGKYCWLTAAAWSGLSADDRINALQGWWIQSGNSAREKGLAFAQLPLPVRNELERIGYAGWVNTFAKMTGPNCFAAIAGAITGDRKLARLWLHWPNLEALLRRLGYSESRGVRPQAADVLVFSNKKEVRHACLYLGEGLYFEKPSQEFSSPYQILKFKHWRKDNPGTTLSVWRR